MARLGDNSIPELPSELGITLPAEQRQPTAFLVQINLDKVNVESAAANGTLAGLTGTLEFSSEAGLQTFAGVMDAKSAGFNVSGNFTTYSSQAFPVTLFKTDERQASAGPPPTFTDPFTNAGFADFGTTGTRLRNLVP